MRYMHINNGYDIISYDHCVLLTNGCLSLLRHGFKVYLRYLINEFLWHALCVTYSTTSSHHLDEWKPTQIYCRSWKVDKDNIKYILTGS